MNRLRRVGLLVSALLLVIAASVPGGGRGIADASLKATRGGELL